MLEDEKYIIYPFFGTMVVFWISYLVIYNVLTNVTRVQGMEQWISTLITGVSSAAISAAVTLFVNRKNQVVKNTEALNKLITRLGITEEETLVHKISGQYDQIRSDIGRETRGNGSLTSQHDYITSEISRDFSTIERRYEKEESEYRAFTAGQKDLETTVRNFVTDYRKLASDGSDYRQKIYSLEKEIKEKNNEISNLMNEIDSKDKKIEELNEQIKDFEKDLNPAKDVPIDDGRDFR